MTKKSDLHSLREKEKYNSRIRDTRDFILNHTKGSLLNNQKWNQIFQSIEMMGFEFEIKTLLSTDIVSSKSILELEEKHILVNHSGNFIKFLEIEKLILDDSSELRSEFDKLNVEFFTESEKIIINGYRK
jgi:predicted TIM-barrel fold metal-dependent hydrolase